jgi:autotransporter adhesin
MLDQDMPQINQENSANIKKQKQKSKSGMMAFTSSARKSKKGSDEIATWSTEGKKFVCEIFNEIKHDEQSGVCKKWEDSYKCMCKATKQDKAKTEDDDDKIEAPFEMDANMLYMEVFM